MKLLKEDFGDVEDISYLIFDTSYGQKYIEELDIASKEEIDHYFTLIRNVHEAEVFNYHSDYWGYDEDYQEQNVELIDALSPYIGKKVTITFEDGQIQGTLLGIAIDRQYNSLSHTKVVFDDITYLDEAFQQPVKGKNKTYSPKLSVEEVKELALEHYNEGGDVVIEAWTDEDIIMWIEEQGTKEELLDLFSKYYDQYQDMIGYGDYAIWDEEDSEDSIDDEQELNQDYYDEEDFGPSNPWDAPGMSIKDFLR